MKDFLMQLVNASFQGGVIITVVMLLRLVLRKTPKSTLCLLWLLAFIRLVLPIQLESNLSLQPDIEIITQQESQQPGVIVEMPRLPAHAAPSTTIKTDDGQLLHVELFYSNEDIAPEPSVTIDWVGLLPWLWLSIAAGLALWSILSYLRLRSRTKNAIVLGDGVWLSPELDSAFVLGFLKPQIYLPVQLDQQEQTLVIAHEQAHIRRFDHWYKLLGFVTLCVHWFNPLVWVAYIFLCRDMEMACDEQVVKDMDTQQRKAYSMALLSCSADRRRFAPCPVAFAEVSVKDRIKGVLNYKKPGFWMTLVGIVAVVFVAVCFLTSPVMEDDATRMTRLCREAVEYLQNADSYRLAERQSYTRISGAHRLGVDYDTAESFRSGKNYLRKTVGLDFTWYFLRLDEQEFIKCVSDAVPPEELTYRDWTAIDLSQIATARPSWLEALDWDSHEIVYMDHVTYPTGLLDVYFSVDLDESDPELTMTTISFRFDPETMTLLSAHKCITDQWGVLDSTVTVEAVKDPIITHIIDDYYLGHESSVQPEQEDLRKKCIDLMKQLRSSEYQYLSCTVTDSDPDDHDSYIRQIETPDFFFMEQLYYKDQSQEPYYQRAGIFAQSGAECYEREIMNPGDDWVQKANEEMSTGMHWPEYLHSDLEAFESYPMDVCQFETGIWCIFDVTDGSNVVKTIEFRFDSSDTLTSIVIQSSSTYGETTRTYENLWLTEAEIQQLADELLAEARKHVAYQQQLEDLEQQLEAIREEADKLLEEDRSKTGYQQQLEDLKQQLEDIRKEADKLLEEDRLKTGYQQQLEDLKQQLEDIRKEAETHQTEP